MTGSPQRRATNPDLIEHRAHHGELYDHYGYTPYWGLDYDYPLFMMSSSAEPPHGRSPARGGGTVIDTSGQDELLRVPADLPAPVPATPTATHDTGTLYALGDRGQTVEGPENDVRGRRVTDKDGSKIGRVADLIVDEQTRKVRFLLVEHGGFLGLGETRTMIPVAAVMRWTETEVVIDQSRDRVASAPGYAPDLIDDHRYHGSLDDHYGYTPYGGMGDTLSRYTPSSPWGPR